MKVSMYVQAVVVSVFVFIGITGCGSKGGSDDTPTTQYKVSGSLSGLNGQLVIQNNAKDDLVITQNGVFTFQSYLKEGDSYEVKVLTQPIKQICSITNGSGVVVDADISDISIACVVDNEIPVANDLNISVLRDSSNNSVVLTASDLDEDNLSFALVSNPTHGTLGGTIPNLTYTPSTNYYGTDSFSFKVNDGIVDSSSAIVNIEVNNTLCNWQLITSPVLDINQSLGAQNPFMTIDKTENILYISWVEDNSYHVKSYDIDTKSWSELDNTFGSPLFVTNQAYIEISKSDGLPYVYYAINNSNNKRERALVQWDGVNWNQIFSTLYYSFLSSDDLILDSANNPIVVGLHGDYDLNFKSYINGNLQNDVPSYIHSGDYNQFNQPLLGVKPSGNLVITSSYYNNNVSGYYHQKVYEYNGAWSSLGYVESNVSERQAVCADLIIDQAGNPVVAFAEKNNPNKAAFGPNIYVKRYNGTSWDTIGDAINGNISVDTANMNEGAGATNNQCVSIAEDETGKLYVAWQYQSAGKRGIVVQKYDGSQWSDAAEHLLEDQKLRTPSIVIDANSTINLSVLYDSTPGTTDMDDIKVYQCVQ